MKISKRIVLLSNALITGLVAGATANTSRISAKKKQTLVQTKILGDAEMYTK